jgi:hypothetical protein
MTLSQNGWIGNDRSLTENRNVPGTDVNLRVRKGPAGDLLIYVAEQFDKRVESIDTGRGAIDDWGYAERPIRGGTELSNHASGTAIDLNATRHPLGASGTVTAQQRTEIHKILAESSWAVRWGGDYVGRKDEMHFEINTDWAGCQRAIDTILARQGQPEEEDMFYTQVQVPHGYAYDKDGNLIDPECVVELTFPPNVDVNGGWFAASVDGSPGESVAYRVALNVEDKWWDVKKDLVAYPENRVHATSFPLQRSYGKISVGRMEPAGSDQVVSSVSETLPFSVAVAK